MINTFSILFSIIGVGFVVIRAAMLDKMLPWFKPTPSVVPSGLLKPRKTGKR